MVHDLNFKYSKKSLVLEYGRLWTPAPKPRGVRFGKKHQCYNNAFNLMSGDLTYCEGFALMTQQHSMSALGEFHHAWLVAADGTVVERTWRQVGAAYYGIAFTQVFVVAQALRSETWGGVLQCDVTCDILRDGLPPSAIREFSGG
jgi:hypothetical protein